MRSSHRVEGGIPLCDTDTEIEGEGGRSSVVAVRIGVDVASRGPRRRLRAGGAVTTTVSRVLSARLRVCVLVPQALVTTFYGAAAHGPASIWNMGGSVIGEMRACGDGLEGHEKGVSERASEWLTWSTWTRSRPGRGLMTYAASSPPPGQVGS